MIDKNETRRIKVLVLTREFYGELMGLGEAFESAGCEVRTILIPTVCSSWNIYIRLKMRLGLSINSYMKAKEKRFSKKIFKICREYAPDIIYSSQGTQLRAETLDELSKRYFLVADLTDRLSFFPELHDIVGHYDVVYTYSKEDWDYMNSQGVNCVYAHEKRIARYSYPINIPKDIDVSFVGRMYPEADYGERYKMLMRLMDDLPNIKMFVGGECAPIRRPEKYVKWVLNKRCRTVFNNKNLTRKECNEVYNRSKICLNINRENTGDTWTDRIINIMSTGSFQLVTYNDTIASEFEGTLDTFKNYDELKEKIVYYLEHEEEREMMAAKGHKMFINIINKRTGIEKTDDIIMRAMQKKHCLTSRGIT